MRNVVEENGGIADEKAGVENVVAKEEPPFARSIAAQRPVHAKDDEEKDEKAKFNKEHEMGAA
jgi:hypothetical protein